MIELTGAPLDGGEEVEEEGDSNEAEEAGEDEEDGEEAEEAEDSAAGGGERPADLRVFIAGGTCLHRVVLYYALTHFQRRLEAGLRAKVKKALRHRGCRCVRQGVQVGWAGCAGGCAREAGLC